MQNTIITKKLARGCCMMYHFLISLRQFSLFFFFLNKKDQPSSLANSKQELGKEITQIAQSNSLGSFIMIKCQMFFLCKFYIYIIRTHPNLKTKQNKKAPKLFSVLTHYWITHSEKSELLLHLSSNCKIFRNGKHKFVSENLDYYCAALCTVIVN